MSAQLDMFGFDPIGADYMSTAAERGALLGLGPLAMAVYWSCLKPFCKGNGRVTAASYYRLGQVLAYARSDKGGRAPAENPTTKQLRTALEALERAGLVVRPKANNERAGVLEIWLQHGVGGTATRTVRAGVRAGSKRPQTRMVA